RPVGYATVCRRVGIQERVAWFRMQRVSNAFMGAVAFETYWEHYRDALHRINPDRYLALGEAQTKAFAKSAYQTACAIGLETIGGICWYLIPCSWLGLHFATDPRYAEVFRRLAARSNGETEAARIESAGEQFSHLADLTVGLEAERLPAALQRFDAQLPWIMDARVTPEAAITMMVEIWGHPAAITATFPAHAFWAASMAELSAIGLHDPAAVKTHLSLAYWLGSGFLRDPQHGWALEAIQLARAEFRDPATALAIAARHRLDQVTMRLAGAA
ncbi:MAG: hypothetical protein ACRC6I_21910, partial [Paracoccaceae bacterium]